MTGPPRYNPRLERDWLMVIPLLGAVWIVWLGNAPGSYFYAIHQGLQRDVWIVPLAGVAGFVFLCSAVAISFRWRRIFAYTAAVIWSVVAALLFVEDIPLGAGLAVLLMVRSAAEYWITPHGSS